MVYPAKTDVSKQAIVRGISITMQCEKISNFIQICPQHCCSQSAHNIEGKSKKIVPIKNTQQKRQFWSDFKKIYIFGMKMKNWIEWTNKICNI